MSNVDLGKNGLWHKYVIITCPDIDLISICAPRHMIETWGYFQIVGGVMFTSY